MGKYGRTEWTEQEILNLGLDDELIKPPTSVRGMLEFTGNGWARAQSGLMACKITVSGTTTYVGLAPIGSAQASAVWQAQKISTTGASTIIEWADSNANFDNVATDLTALTYS